jgi:hypothetical protein
MKSKQVMCIAWPSFLIASVLEMLVFAFVDPLEMSTISSMVNESRELAYTAFFFVFWAVIAVACAITLQLMQPPDATEWECPIKR